MSLIKYYCRYCLSTLYPLALATVGLCFLCGYARLILFVVGLMYWIIKHYWSNTVFWIIAFILLSINGSSVNTASQLDRESVTVLEVKEKSYLVDSDYGKLYLISDDLYYPNDQLIISGNINPLQHHYSFYSFDMADYGNKEGIIGSIFEPIIHESKQGFSLPGLTMKLLVSCFGKDKGKALINCLWFNNDSNHLFILFSGYLLMSIINGICTILSYFICDTKVEKLKISLIIVVGLFIEFHFLMLRYLIKIFLKRYNLQKDERFGLQVILWLLISKGDVTSLSFVYPFIFSLLTLVNNQLSKTYGMVVSCFIQGLFLHRINLFSIFTFGLSKAISACLYVLSIVEIVYDKTLIPTILDSLDRYLIINSNPLGYGLVFYIAIVSCFNKWPKVKHVIALVLYILMAANGWFHPLATVTFINVEQGDSILIKSMFNQSVILIDTGPESSIEYVQNYLHGLGIQHVNALIVTHADSDHSGNKEVLMDQFNIDTIIEDPFELVDINGIKLENINFTLSEDENDSSLVILFELNGVKFLLPADISESIEKELFNSSKLNVDIFKASHHGSKTGNSDFLLDTLQPKIMIYSAGSPSIYNHPNQTVIQKALRRHILQFNTYQHGDLSFYGIGDGLLFLSSNGQVGYLYHKN